MHRLRSTFAAALLGLMLPAGASAWSPAELTSPAGREGRTPAVAMNAAGTAALVWVDGNWSNRAIAVSIREDGVWSGQVQRVSPLGGVAIDPQVAIADDGSLLVVWRQAAGRQRLRIAGKWTTVTRFRVQARHRDAAGNWSASSVALSPPRLKVGRPSLAMAADGSAVVAWHWGTGTSPRRAGFVGQVQTRIWRDGAWTPLRRVSGSDACREERGARAAMGRRGHAVVSWQCDVRGGSTAYAVAAAPGDSRWSERRELPFRTAGNQRSDLAVAPDGEVVAVSAARGGPLRWWRGGFDGSGIRLGELPRPGSSEQASAAPRLSVDGNGDALTAWVAAGERFATRAAPVAAGLGPGTPVSLPAQGSAGSVAVDSAAGRRGALAWREMVGRQQAAVVVATRSENGSWLPPRRVSTIGAVNGSAGPRLAAAGGRVLVAWERTVNGRPVIERAAFPTS